MARGLAELISGLLTILPLKVVIGISVVAGIALAPRWLESIRDRQLRGYVRRMVRASTAERAQLADAALALAGTKVERLRVLALVAQKYDQRSVLTRAMAALDATGRAPDEVRRLRDQTERAPARFRDPVEAAVRIERMVEDHLLVAAREQIGLARQAFPADEELAALAARIDRKIARREGAAAAVVAPGVSSGGPTPVAATAAAAPIAGAGADVGDTDADTDSATEP